MSETAARVALQEVLAQIQEDHVAYPLAIELDNRFTINQETQDKPYLKVMLDFLRADQADMADKPRTRHLGQIVLSIATKHGSGCLEASALRDFVMPYFNLKQLGPMQCQAAERHRSVPLAGWEHFPVLINFWQHEVSA
jgi:hypothetical protein